MGVGQFGTLAIIARWKPVHLGHEAVLRAICRLSDRALIGIGSSNRYDCNNPFTAVESREMIEIVLEDFSNFELLEIPDLDDGPRWREMVISMMPELDYFLTDNPYVASLLADDYRIMRPVELLSPEDRVAVEGRMVRRAMARGDRWEDLLSEDVGAYLRKRGLDQRFRREFGLETLAEFAGTLSRPASEIPEHSNSTESGAKTGGC